MATKAWCPRTAANVRGIWKRYVGMLGNLSLREVKPSHIEILFFDTRHRSAGWANYRGKFVRGFFLWALRHGMVTRDPTIDIWPELPECSDPVFRTVSREEERKICGKAPRPLARYVVLAIATGLRRGTLYRLVWAWVTLDWILAIPAGALKNRRPIRIPLNKRAIEALGKRRDPESPLLPNLPRIDRINEKIRYWARQAGVSSKNLTTHQFRRTWVERFRDAGGTREECQLVQGWQSSNVLLERYWPRVTVDRARSILEKI